MLSVINSGRHETIIYCANVSILNHWFEQTYCLAADAVSAINKADEMMRLHHAAHMRYEICRSEELSLVYVNAIVHNVYGPQLVDDFGPNLTAVFHDFDSMK
ncbi:hypothetical protein OWV82_014538 [Melia azedarach]|uniref:Uncharacterized protein n=1 Tax=Melia azedarach TaxID=155640 RepID=A0ACC1XMX0_MELAZ|nr:hypothetical protein OWV82_014538 [Melia azedarach]